MSTNTVEVAEGRSEAVVRCPLGVRYLEPLIPESVALTTRHQLGFSLKHVVSRDVVPTSDRASQMTRPGMVAELVRILRDRVVSLTGLTKQEVALALGVDRRSLSGYVSGSIRPPDERLRRLRVLDETARWAVDEYGVRAGELLRGRYVEVSPLALIAQGEADVRQTVADSAARIEPGPGYAVRSRDRGSPRSMTKTQRARLARASVKPIRNGVARDPSVYEQDLGEAVKGVPEPRGPRRTHL